MSTIIEPLEFKIIIVGDSGVGKTCLIDTFCGRTFNLNSSSTIVVDYSFKRLIIDDKIVKLIIWDTAGQEKYRSFTNLYYRYSLGVFFVYDITQKKTLFNMQEWFNEVKKFAPPGIIKFLIGHKCDLKDSRQISTEEGKAVADYFKMDFYEVSSKTHTNVDCIFNSLAIKIMNSNLHQNFRPQEENITIRNENNNNPQDNSSCFLDTIYNWFKLL